MLRDIVPNLAPLVDVVMVILIFFMLGTSFATSEAALPTRLPADVGPGGEARVTIVPIVQIALLAGTDANACRIIAVDQELPTGDFESLRRWLSAKLAAGADANGRVALLADPTVRYRHVISALDACIRAGFRNVQFSVDPGRSAG
ncbi:MAG: biopolymer transporter ExbD [Phycisphaerae bacterium]|nr:biopolymer transporter ExbD [Phycisphaerae bacterium]